MTPDIDAPTAEWEDAASERLASLTSDIDRFFEAANMVNDPNHLAHYLATLRDVKQHVGLVFDEIERALLAHMPAKKLEVPYLGIVERKQSTRRTRWQHDDLFRSVVARVADEPGVFYDPEDGAMVPPAQLASNLVDRLRDVMSPSWKVTGIRSLGLDETEFCQVDEAVDQIVLPPKAAA